MGLRMNNSCCSLNTPPWFHKQLSSLTADDIEMRVCTDEGTDDENVYIEMVEISEGNILCVSSSPCICSDLSLILINSKYQLFKYKLCISKPTEQY